MLSGEEVTALTLNHAALAGALCGGIGGKASSQGTKRWVIRRESELVAAVRGGLLSLEEACERYTLTVENTYSNYVRSRLA